MSTATKTAFTPGPWSAEVHVISEECPERFGTVAGPDGRGIVYITEGTIADPEQLIANANLIAAAPEMYEALKRVMENKWEPDKYHMAVTEAIRKAEGK